MITGELTQWRLDKNAKTVMGLKVNPETGEEETVVIKNYKWEAYYPDGIQNAAHILIRLQTDTYIILFMENEKTE